MPAAGSSHSRTLPDAPDPLFEAVFHAGPDPAAIIDADHRAITVNTAFQAVFGAGPWRGKGLDGLFHDEVDARTAPWKHTRARGRLAKLVGAGGDVFAAEITFSPLDTLLDTGGGVVTFKRDEAAHTRQEMNQARLTETFAASKAGGFAMDLSTGQGHCSGVLTEVFPSVGSDGRLSLSTWRDAVAPGDQAVIDDALAAARGRLFAPIVFIVHVRDPQTGAPRALRHELTAAALDDKGFVVRLTGAVSDATELAAEVSARQDAERLNALAADLAGLSGWSFDPVTGEGRIRGPLSEAFGGPEFTARRWAAALGGDAGRQLHTALCAAEYGAAVELSIEAGGDLCDLRGERLQSGLIEGFAVMRDAAKTAARQQPADEAAASAQMSAWSYDIARRRLHLSGPVLGLLGLPGPERVLDIEAWRSRVADEDLAQMDRATEALLSIGVADVEYRVRAADGRFVWLNLRGGVSEQDSAGAPLRFSGFLSEVGPRKQLERKLAERERQLTDAVDAGLVGIWAYDYATGVQTARGPVLDLMGKPRDASTVEEADWVALVHRDDQPALRRAFAEMISGRSVDRVDIRLRTPDGWRWTRTHGAPLDPTPDGAPRRAAGVLVDVHAERAFENALKAERERFEAVYRKTPALLHTIDPSGRTLSVSDHWLSRMGYAREQVIGAPGWAFFDEESARRVRDDVLPRTLAEGAVENAPILAVTASGERLELRLSAFLETDDAGAPVAAHGVYSDIGDLNAARRTLEDHAAALERSNRELNRFTTAASHDLQEPLRKISAFASLLRRRLSREALDRESDQALEFLIDAAGRMRALIDDLLAYSRTSNRALELKSVALGPLVKTVTSTLDLQAREAEAEIVVGALPAVTGDEVLLGLVFQNLISNALKYRDRPGVRVEVSAARTGEGAWAVTVEDDGIGFDMAFAAKIFEPFARLHTREEYSGTGIGLAICQQAAERLGGRIEVRSEPGRGAAFTVILPAERSEATPA